MIPIDTTVGRALKHSVDLVASLVGLIVLSPVFLGVAALIRLDSRGPVFFRQLRVGVGGAPFTIWKFRTMTHDAYHNGPGITSEGDPRITRVGRFLRSTKLDELPQLFNVLKGEMSLVGPRPEILPYVALYTETEKDVLQFRPGITDPASLRFKNEEALLATADDPLRYYREVVMREKLALNLEYRRKATVTSDFWVLLKTVGAIVRSRSPHS